MEQRYIYWFEKLKEIWVTQNPSQIATLCANSFMWYETPFDKPITTKEKLVEEWQSVLHQEDISLVYEVLSLNENSGFAHWHAQFTLVYTKERVELDGIFQVKLEESGRCKEFRQWYNTR